MYVSLRLLYKLSSGCKKYTIQKRKKNRININNFQFIDFQKIFLNFEKALIFLSEKHKNKYGNLSSPVIIIIMIVNS